MRYTIGLMTYYELEYDQPQTQNTIISDFWDKVDANELGQGEMYEIETILDDHENEM